MVAYADLDSVKAALGNQGPSGDVKLAEDNVALSLAFDRKTGRRFGVETTVTGRSVRGRGGTVLPLPTPIRAMPTSVLAAGATVPTNGLALWLFNGDGEAWALVRTDGGVWPLDRVAPSVLVTAAWADTVGDVPDDVREALNVLVRYTALADKAGPTGVLGPEGQELRLPDIWKDERIKQAVAHWTIKPWVAP